MSSLGSCVLNKWMFYYCKNLIVTIIYFVEGLLLFHLHILSIIDAVFGKISPLGIKVDDI